VSPRVTTQEVLDRLAPVHPLGEWMTYREAWRIDLFALRCWESGPGFRRVGYEVKVSRGDFLHELRKPGKSANAMSLTHQFYFACPWALIRPEEVPDTCGLVWVHDDDVLPSIVKRAPVTDVRPFTEREIVYLARFQWFRDGIRELNAEVLWLRAEVDKLGGRPYPRAVTNN
jgi:hypothetical protein